MFGKTGVPAGKNRLTSRFTGKCKNLPVARLLEFMHVIIPNMPRARGYKTFFMLTSAEHEILNVHKYKDIKKFGFVTLR